jgi:hypothetical protein
MTRTLGVVVLAVTALTASRAVEAATITYNDLGAYLAGTGPELTDTFDATGYLTGDVFDNGTVHIHSDAHMSAVFGETDYRSTGFTNWNIITDAGTRYCAGCNGSFELIFTSTSMGTATGVFGVGLDFENRDTLPYHAFVTFGDGTTTDYALPVAFNVSGFWGITSDRLVSKIDFGLANGGVTQDGYFQMDTLRLSGERVVPEPTSFLLLGSGVATLLMRRRRR